jgi:hypothetical protein
LFLHNQAHLGDRLKAVHVLPQGIHTGRNLFNKWELAWPIDEKHHVASSGFQYAKKGSF